MKHKFFTILLLVILVSSCKSYIQLFDTKTSNTKNVDDKYIYENDTVKITYNFWKEKGIMSFEIYNKLNKPMFIDWKKSSYINNTVKLNYWEDTEKTKSIEQRNFYTYSSKSLLGNIGYSSSISNGSSTMTRAERITFIPPKSKYPRILFRIFPYNSLKVDYTNTIEIPQINNKSKITKIFEKEFDKSNSPLTFRNFITLSLTETFTKEIYVDNEFYISKVTKIERNQFGAYKYDPKLGSSFYIRDENGQPQYVCPYEKGTSFYIRLE